MNFKVSILLIAYLSDVKAVFYEPIEHHGNLKYKEIIHKTLAPSIISCSHKCRLIDKESEVLWNGDICNCLIRSKNEEENEKEIASNERPILKKKEIWKRLVIQIEERAITKGHLQADIAKLSKEYVLSLDLKPTSWYNGKTNALLITNGHPSEYGIFTPKLGFFRNKLWIASAINSDAKKNYLILLDDTYLDQWMNIKVSQRKIASGEFEFVIEVNGVEKHSVINNNPGEFFQLKCFTSRIDFTAQDGFLKNIWIDMLAD